VDRKRIKKLGTFPMNGNDAYAILEIVFDWMEKHVDTPSPDPEELQAELKEAGYSFEPPEMSTATKVIKILEESGHSLSQAAVVVRSLSAAGVTFVLPEEE
jgi:hypothetical protein